MTFPKSGLMLGLSTLALTMAGCGWGDKSPSEEITVETPSLGLSGADERELSEHFAVERRAGTEAKTKAALAALGLSERDGIMADEVAINGSTVTYTNWRVTANDTTVTADRVVLTGLHQVDDRATFDRMDVTALVASSAPSDDRFDARLEELIVVGPTVELANELAAVLRGDDADIVEGGPLANVSGEKRFRALKLKDLTLEVAEPDGSGGENEGRVEVDQIVLGIDPDTRSVDAVIEQIDLDWFSPASNYGLGGSATLGAPDAAAPQRVTLSMDGLTVLDLNTSDPTQWGLGRLPGLRVFGLSALTSPSLTAPYREADLGQLRFSTRAFDLNMEGFEAQSTTRGDVTEISSVLSPALIRLKDVSTTPLAPFGDKLSQHGFDEITLKGSQTMTLDRGADLVSVTDAKTEIDGGLRLDCDYDVSGAGAAQAYQEASGLSVPNYEGLETQADLSAFFTEVENYQQMLSDANSRIKLNSLECVVQDIEGNSLVDRGYAMASDVTGSPVAVMKGTAKTAIALGSLTAPTNFQRDLMDTVGSGLIKFLDKPGRTMTVRANPAEPVSVMALTQQPDEQTFATFNLSVEVE